MGGGGWVGWRESERAKERETLRAHTREKEKGRKAMQVTCKSTRGMGRSSGSYFSLVILFRLVILFKFSDPI